MKLFECQNCGQQLYFENRRCERCGSALGLLPGESALSALKPKGGDLWRPVAAPDMLVRYCANAAFDACNWMTEADSPDAFCRACSLNRTIPNLDINENIVLWRRLEVAKRRLIFELLRIGLPLTSKKDDPVSGLAFDFLTGSGATFREGPKVVTGHQDGVVTIDLAEADHVERERHRQDLAEPYRTLLGHFRHEVGHYYWDRLVQGTHWLQPCREMFGDERADYAAALDAHYVYGPRPDWQKQFVSGYAASHPWEDFAETWAHYLHIVDTLETAGAFGIRIRPQREAGGDKPSLSTKIDFDPCNTEDFDVLIEAWLPLTYAVNSLNRSMGQRDFYPFVLAPPIIEKLRFIHAIVRNASAGDASRDNSVRSASRTT